MKLTHIPYFVLFAFITVFTDSLYAQGILSSGTLVVVKPEKIGIAARKTLRIL